MSLLLGWSARRVVRAVEEALGTVEGSVAVVDRPLLARALAERQKVVTVAPTGRALKRTPGAIRATGGALPLGDGSLAAVVGAGAGDVPDAAALLGEWSRAVREGGVVVLVDKTEPQEVTRRALCAGLVDLEQREAGGLVVTSGRVRKW